MSGKIRESKEAGVPKNREHRQRVIIEHEQGEEKQEASLLVCTRLSSVLCYYGLVNKYVSQMKWSDGACRLTCYPFVPDAVCF